MKRFLLVLFIFLASAGICQAFSGTGTYIDIDTFNTVAEEDEFLQWADSVGDPPVWQDRGGDPNYEDSDFYEAETGDYDLITYVSGLNSGTKYDIRVVFAGYDSEFSNWGINAGFSLSDLTAYYHEDGISEDLGPYNSNAKQRQLQVMIGSAVADGFGEIPVYIRPGIEGDQRTRYDGVTYTPTLVDFVHSGGITEIEEDGFTDTFDVVLLQAPSADVSVALNYDSNQISLSDSLLLFTTSNWDTAQTITVTPVDDIVIEDVHTTPVIAVASSTDATFNGYSVSTQVQIIDDDIVYMIGNYVDANLTNTADAYGDPNWYVAGDYNSTYEYYDGKWWYRTGWENALEGDVLQQNNETRDINGVEITDQRLIITTIDGLTTGTEYEVRAAFWGRSPDSISEWNIKAGLDPNDMEIFSYLKRYRNIQGTAVNITTALTTTGISAEGGNAVLYQPLLGTAVADSNGEIAVYVNGEDLVGVDRVRTMYEGLLYQESKLDIVESDGFTGVNDGTNDSFTIALASNANGSDVTVEIIELYPSDEVTLSTDTLTFSSGNYTTAQQVTVTGNLNDPNIANTTLVIKAESADPDYDGYQTTLQVLDLACGAWGVLPLDFNQDCLVDFKDLFPIVQNWAQCTSFGDEGCESALPWE